MYKGGLVIASYNMLESENNCINDVKTREYNNITGDCYIGIGEYEYIILTGYKNNSLISRHNTTMTKVETIVYSWAFNQKPQLIS